MSDARQAEPVDLLAALIARRRADGQPDFALADLADPAELLTVQQTSDNDVRAWIELAGARCGPRQILLGGCLQALDGQRHHEPADQRGNPNGRGRCGIADPESESGVELKLSVVTI